MNFNSEKNVTCVQEGYILAAAEQTKYRLYVKLSMYSHCGW